MASYIKPCVISADEHVNIPLSVSVPVTVKDESVVAPVTFKVPPIVALLVTATPTPTLLKVLVPAKVGTAFTKEALAILADGKIIVPATVNPLFAVNKPVFVVAPVTAKVPPIVMLLVTAMAVPTLLKVLVPANVGTAETNELLATLAAGKMIVPNTVKPPLAVNKPV